MKNAHHRYVIKQYHPYGEIFSSSDLQAIRNKLNEVAIKQHIESLTVHDMDNGSCEKATKIAAGGQFHS